MRARYLPTGELERHTKPIVRPASEERIGRVTTPLPFLASTDAADWGKSVTPMPAAT